MQPYDGTSFLCMFLVFFGKKESLPLLSLDYMYVSFGTSWSIEFLKDVGLEANDCVFYN